MRERRTKTRRPLVVRPRVEGGTVARAAHCKGRREVLSLAAGWLFPGGHEQHAADGMEVREAVRRNSACCSCRRPRPRQAVVPVAAIS